MLDKVRNLPRGMKASIAFFISSLVTKGIAYITTPLYTRLLTTEEYGQTSVFLTWLHVFGIIAMFCLQAGVFNNGMVDYPDRRNEYSFSMLILSNIITICFTGILLCLYPVIRPYIGMDIPLILLMCLVFLFQPVYNFWVSRQRYELKYKYVTFWAIASAIVSPLVAIVCIKCFPDNRLYGRIFGAEGILICIYIGFYIYQAKNSNYHVDTSFWKQALLFNLPLIPHYLSTYLLNSSDKLMISYLVSDTATAYYSVAYAVASVVTIVWTAAHASLIPFVYEKCKVKDYNSISRVTIPILAVFGGACIMIILMAPEVVAIMATKDYREAIYVIPPIVGGVFFQVHYYLYADVLYYYKRPKFVMIGSLVATISNIVLNYIFIRQFGYMAAGYTTIVCYLIQALIDYFAMRSVVGESIYNMKYIIAMSVGLSIIALVSNMTYDYPVIRYTLVVLLAVVLFVKRKQIIAMFTGLKKKTV